jgi:trimeric autotransporter adhesin
MTRFLKLLALGLVVITPLATRAQNITTVAGGGPSSAGPGSVGIGAPEAVRKDSLGNWYVMDNEFGRIYKVDTTGKLTLFAGNGVNGYNGNAILAVDAAMSGPSGMCLDSSNNVYIADSDNAIIREIPVSGPNAGKIITVAGTQTETNFTYGGDGGSAISPNAQLHFPDGCSFDSHGNMYIADRGNNAIRVVIGTAAVAPVGIAGPVTAGNIYLFAGGLDGVPPNPPSPGYGADGATALGAALNGPFDVFVDSHDNVFIGIVGNPGNSTGANVIREVPAATAGGKTAGHIYTVAGVPGAGGPPLGTPIPSGIAATTALLNSPVGIYVNSGGDLFFADSANQVVREVPATTAGGMTAGDIYTLAGSGSRGYAGDCGSATSGSLSFPMGTFIDSNGNLVIADSSSDAIRVVVGASNIPPTGLTCSTGAAIVAGDIYTYAGNGNPSFASGTPATAGELNTPAGIAVDASGNLLIADTQNDLIRKVAAPIASGALTTVTGRTGDNGFAGDGSPVANGVENTAAGVFTDGSGNVFIADTLNCIVREITGGNIVTVAGTDPTPSGGGTTPVCGFAGAGGVATAATIGQVNGVAVDASGNIFFSDSTNNIIWEVAKNTAGAQTAGHIYIAAGTQSTTGHYGGDGGPATSAQFHSPTGIFIDIFGNLFIADTNNNVIREVSAANTSGPSMTAGDIYTVAGKQSLGPGFFGDGGPAISAQLNAPFTMVVDHAGNIFIADTNNQVIRKVASSNGFISTVAGTPGTPGFGGDGGPATSALLEYPEGLALDGAGDLLLADSGLFPGPPPPPTTVAVGRIRSVATIASEGAVPVASFSANSLTFLPQPQNITSAQQNITLTNTGGASLTGIGLTKGGSDPGDFAISNTTCTSTLTAGANCTISVTFTPTVLGARSATLSVADNALGNPQIIDLSGTGIAGSPADVTTPPSLTFTTQTVGTTSAAQNITVSNATGTAPLSIAVNGIAIGGTNAGDFLISANNCGTTVAIGASCMISVEFKPTSATPTARSASLTVTDNAADSPRTVTLSGTAQPAAAPAATLSGNSVKFSDQFVTTTSAAQTVTLTNSGNAALTISNIAVAGANPKDYNVTTSPATNCGGSLAASAKCTISVTFAPAASGASSATITITDNANPTTQTVNVSGAGFTISLAPASNGSLSQTVTAGQTATYNLQFTAAGGSGSDSISVALACSGAPTAATCNAPATTTAPGTFSVTVPTTARGALPPQSQPVMRMQPPAIRVLPLTLMALLLCIAALLAAMQSPAGRMRTARLAIVACLVLLPIAAASVLVGCGGGSSSSTPPPQTGTPAGTYTLTLAATPSGGTAQNTQLTLIVQ